MGGPDASAVDCLTIQIKPNDGAMLMPSVLFNGTDTHHPEPDGIADIDVGSQSVFSNGNFTYNDHVTVIATFPEAHSRLSWTPACDTFMHASVPQPSMCYVFHLNKPF